MQFSSLCRTAQTLTYFFRYYRWPLFPIPRFSNIRICLEIPGRSLTNRTWKVCPHISQNLVQTTTPLHQAKRTILDVKADRSFHCHYCPPFSLESTDDVADDKSRYIFLNAAPLCETSTIVSCTFTFTSHVTSHISENKVNMFWNGSQRVLITSQPHSLTVGASASDWNISKNSGIDSFENIQANIHLTRIHS